jgi:hypothetical protein
MTQFSVFLVGSLSSTVCTASLVKALAPRSVEKKKRRQKPLILLLLLKCSKDAPSSRAICSLISDEAVSIAPYWTNGWIPWFPFVDAFPDPVPELQ